TPHRSSTERYRRLSRAHPLLKRQPRRLRIQCTASPPTRKFAGPPGLPFLNNSDSRATLQRTAEESRFRHSLACPNRPDRRVEHGPLRPPSRVAAYLYSSAAEPQ